MIFRVLGGDGNINEDRFLEYPSPTKLKHHAARHINIPSSLILDTDMDLKRIATFIFCRKTSGYDDSLLFNLNTLVAWSGYTVCRNLGCTNSKFLDSINELEDKQYLTIESVSSKSFIQGAFNLDKVKEDCNKERFAVLYLDEVEKIMSYKMDSSSKYINKPVVLLVFAYLRSVIYRRPNKLRPEERYLDGQDSKEYDIAERRKAMPEAYNGKFIDMANELGITQKALSKAVEILEDLGLIVTARAYCVKVDKDKYKTLDTIFANAYKREGSSLLDGSCNYSKNEIKNKVKIMQRYNKDYVLKE